jgi:hypothetical protein
MAIPSRVRIRSRSTSNSANVALGNHERVALADGGERLLKSWSSAVAAGHAVIEIHAVVAHAELAQRVTLRSEVLLVSRAARVANQHVGTSRRHEVSRVQRSGEILLPSRQGSRCT